MASGGHSSSRCAGLSPSRPLLLRSTGSRRAGSVVVAHGPSCSAACGVLPDQGSNPCPLHWQADSQPLRHQGSPAGGFLTTEPPGKPTWSYFWVRAGAQYREGQIQEGQNECSVSFARSSQSNSREVSPLNCCSFLGRT